MFLKNGILRRGAGGAVVLGFILRAVAPALSQALPLFMPLARSYIDLYFETPDRGYVLTYTEVLKTTDAGASWQLVLDFQQMLGSSPAGRRPEIAQSFFLNGSTAWLRVETSTPGQSSLLFRTDNGFASVERISAEFARHDKLGVGSVTDVFFLDGLRGWGVGRPYHVVRTTDGGGSWSSSLLPQSLREARTIAMLSADRGLMATAKAVVRTTDGGITWSPTAGSPEGVKTLRCTGLKCFALTTLNAVFMSGDAGATWARETVPIDLPPSNDGRDMVNDLQVVTSHAASRAYVFGVDTHIPPQSQRGVVQPDGSVVYPAVHSTAFLVTYDGGGWTRRNYADISSLGVGQFIDATNGWAAADENTVFRTSDGGKVWTFVPDYFRQIAALTPVPAPIQLPTPP